MAPRQTVSSSASRLRRQQLFLRVDALLRYRFLYGANRLHDGLACFAIGKNGTLTFVAEEWTRGDYPRSFNFDPTGNFLYVCNQRADNVTAFRVDRKSGSLTFTGQYTPVGNPSTILFLDLAESK